MLLAPHAAILAQHQVEWTTTWADAQALAARHQRLILIHFWSPDCPPCLKLERTVFNQPEFIRAVGTNYIPLKINAAADPPLVRHFGVDRFPTDVILSASGQEIYRSASPLDVNRYIGLLDQVASHARVGMPMSGSPTTEVAVTPSAWGGAPSAAAPTAPGFPTPSTDSATFPVLGAAGGPAATGSPAGYVVSNNYPAPPVNSAAILPSVPPAASPVVPALEPKAPAWPTAGLPSGSSAPGAVTNQWVTNETPGVRMPIAEQRASFTAPAGGDFQVPAGTALGPPVVPPMPAASSTPMAAGFSASPSAAVLGPPRAENGVGGVDLPAAAAPLSPPVQPQGAAPPAAEPQFPLALDGYCPVTLVEREKWVKGDPKWGARHRGRTYLFAGPEEQKRFFDNQAFDKYAPALSGYDAVKFVEQGATVNGKRAHGVFYRGQVFLFVDEATLQQFWTDPERYAAVVRAELQQSAMRANLQR
jgi:YHS domain-containing protein/thiol-disulfide isomerase/thioredoxin